VLGHQRREIPIFTQRQKILLVQRVDIAIAVLGENSVGDDQGLAFISSAETIHRETAAG
jgi:hypothetical protein